MNPIKKLSEENFTEPQPNQVIRREGVPPPAGMEPIFREFIEYMIETDLGSYEDDHWMSYYLFCTPCLVKYDIIAKISKFASEIADCHNFVIFCVNTKSSTQSL